MTITRIILSLLAGALAGGLLFGAFDLSVELVRSGLQNVLKYRLQASFAISAMASIIWLIGLVMCGLPFWLWMHKTGRTTWWHAVLLGFGLTFIVAFALNTKFFDLLPASGSSFSAGDSGGPTWIDNHLTLHGWVSALQGSLLFALSGILVALCVWAVAYKAGR